MQCDKIYFANDHGGVEAKNFALEFLKNLGIPCVDLGVNDSASVDYPDYANALADALKDDLRAFGILICGSGIGISMAANRHKHIRCALCYDANTARLARAHNDANVLAFGGRNTLESAIKSMLEAFVNTSFEGGRHERRVNKLKENNGN